MPTRRFALVEWIADGSFGTMPMSAVKDATEKDNLHVGMETKMRYPVKGKRFYDVEILKLSGDYHSLQADAQKLADYEITKEEYLGCTVGTSSSEPVAADRHASGTSRSEPLAARPQAKKAKTRKRPVPPTVKKGSAARQEEIKLALQKAKDMDSSATAIIDITNSTEVRDGEKQTTAATETKMPERREKQNKIRNENQIISIPTLPTTDKSNDSSVSRYNCSYERDYDSCWSTQNYLDDSYYEEYSNYPYTDYADYRTSSPFQRSPAPLQYDYRSNSSSCPDMGNLSSSSRYNTAGAFQCSTSSSSSAVASSIAPKRHFTETSTSAVKRLHMDGSAFKKESPPAIELVEGYGVFASRRALDDAIDSCRHTATRLMRNLVGIFFSDEILRQSNACGGGKKNHVALDQDILGACYKFVLNMFPDTAKSELKDAVNDCCCNARRKKGKMKP